MVRRIPIFVAAFAISVVGMSAYGAPKSVAISSVVVEQSGNYTGGPVPEALATSCSTFHLSNKDAMKWFVASREVPNAGFSERAVVTGCSASGYLIAKDKKRYKWELDLGGSGFIHLSSDNSISLLGPELSLSGKISAGKHSAGTGN